MLDDAIYPLVIFVFTAQCQGHIKLSKVKARENFKYRNNIGDRHDLNLIKISIFDDAVSNIWISITTILSM